MGERGRNAKSRLSVDETLEEITSPMDRSVKPRTPSRSWQEEGKRPHQIFSSAGKSQESLGRIIRMMFLSTIQTPPRVSNHVSDSRDGRRGRTGDEDQPSVERQHEPCPPARPNAELEPVEDRELLVGLLRPPAVGEEEEMKAVEQEIEGELAAREFGVEAAEEGRGEASVGGGWRGGR